MSVSYCIAARGHPQLLRDSAAITWAMSRRDDTRLVIALDDDDGETIAAAEQLKAFAGEKIVLSVAPREDTLGAKYNRAWRAHRADLYVIGCDDTAAITEGWDTLLAGAECFADGIGAVYFGHMPGVFQGGQAVTGALAEELGYLAAPYFPTWWHDTWLDEIVRMLDRVHLVPVALKAIGPVGRTRGLRDIAWWATFFDVMRDERRAQVEGILRSASFAASSEWRAGLLKVLPYHCANFAARTAHFRDPATVARFEADMAYDAPDDARYLRAKDAALKVAIDLQKRLHPLRRVGEAS